MQARNVFDQTIVPLYQKDFGEDLALPEAWSTAVLREGQYHLEVLQQELTDGLETAPRMVSFAAVCPLTVLHHAPELLGLVGGVTSIPVVDLEKGFDWKADRDFADLHVCMEELSTVSRDPSLWLPCQASGACQNPTSFKAMKSIRLEREGLYQIFAFAQDYAANQSALQCRTAIFLSQAPVFDVRWNKEAWNRAGAVLDDTIPILQAKVSGLAHAHLAQNQLEEKDGSWSLVVDIRAHDDTKTLGCHEDSRFNVFVRTEAGIWVFPPGQGEPQKLTDAPKEQAPEIFIEDRQGAVWFACLSTQGAPALCSYQDQKLQVFSLPVENFDPFSNELCGFEIDHDLYFLGRNFATVLSGPDRKFAVLPSRNIQFPGGTELAVEGCTRVGSRSALIRSQSGDRFHLFHEGDRTLKSMPALDGGLSNVIRQVRSKDGHIYLSNDEGREGLEANSLSDRILQGQVMRIEADGSIVEVLPRELRIRAFDQRTSFPLRFFTDENGTLWSIALDYSLWTFRLIQFAEFNPGVR